MDVEVLNIFTPVIDRGDDLRGQWDQRKRQGMIPDMFFPTSGKLADIKTMSCCKSHYSPARFRQAVQHDAVRVRQGTVHAEYMKKARTIDEDFNGYPSFDNQPGPVQLKLTSFGRVKGLVCGAFGEGSPDLHKLCDKIADVAASTKFMEMGAISMKTAKSRASRYVFRTVGIEMIRGTAALRNYRMDMVLAGNASAKAAAARRVWSRNRWEQEQEAYFYSHSYGSHAHEQPW